MSLKFLRWANDPDKVLSWMEQYDLPQLLHQSGGLVKISNFLPDFAARGALEVLEGLREEDWKRTEAKRDAEYNNINHKFLSSKKGRNLPELLRIISVLQPGRLHTFSAGKYQHADHIESHDDRAYTEVVMDDGRKVTCSRDIAVIYYLTKDWKEENGGALVDVETGKRYLPEFNSLIAFKIPRYHAVEPVKGLRPRYSIFGWFLTEGILYDLYRGEEEQAKTVSSRRKKLSRKRLLPSKFFGLGPRPNLHSRRFKHPLLANSRSTTSLAR